MHIRAEPGLIPIDAGSTATAALRHQHNRCDIKWRPITMLAIIAFVLIAIVALSVLSFAVHLLSPLPILLAIGILVWIKFRPRRSHQ
jgi:hypothetical protein